MKEEGVMDTKGTKKLKIIDVSGSHYEMGIQYGKACPEISGMLDITCQLYGGQKKVNSILDKYVPMYLPYMEEYAPEIVEQLKGMAAGAKVDFRDILFLNITYEISVPTVMEGCTSFAASGDATADGKLITGQNLDHIEPWKDYMILLKMKPANGPGIMAVTAAGCLGLIGMNSAGISINLNLLRNKDSLELTGGVPTHVIVNKLFMSENIDKAIAAIASAEGRSAKNYLLAHGQEGIVNIETTTNDMEIQFPEKGVLTHANCFKTDRFKSTDLAPLLVPDSYIRFPRLLQLMEQHYGNISVDVMKQLLQDHVNYPNSICRHPDKKALLPYARIMKTLISIISCPEERKAYIATGNPCENEYVEYQL
jgi:isopenicillin-N N-acyltransferase-like protein